MNTIIICMTFPVMYITITWYVEDIILISVKD